MIASCGAVLFHTYRTVIDDQLNVAPVTEEWSKTTAEDIAAGKVTLQVLLIL